VLATGSIPVDSKPTDPIEQLSMEKPALFTVTILKELLEKNGVRVKGKAVLGTKPAQAELIASHDSPPLSEIVNILNKPSDNFMAESLLKTLGKEIKGKGTFDAGIEVEKDWLRKIGADMDAIRIADASGLSRRDSISPQNLTTVLTHMYHTRNYGILSNSFPIAGVDSHLKDRMLNTPAVNNVKAKTGYVSLVCSLSGYVTTLAGENLAVSIIQNNHTCSLDEANVIQDIIFVALSKITTRTDAVASPAAK
jgi:D-alanyl-D-alanine carboxypeptidase/D-alanyl-D-alanine-endopeptidase (penicillin-binding protein 4)